METPDSVRPCQPRFSLAVCAIAMLFAAQGASACDGSSYSFNIAVGAIVSAGGLIVRLDKVKFITEAPDKYYISVKDDGDVLADHALLLQHDTLNLKTKCGTVSIGADRKSFFGSGTLKINWSYF